MSIVDFTLFDVCDPFLSESRFWVFLFSKNNEVLNKMGFFFQKFFFKVFVFFSIHFLLLTA